MILSLKCFFFKKIKYNNPPGNKYHITIPIYQFRPKNHLNKFVIKTLIFHDHHSAFTPGGNTGVCSRAYLFKNPLTYLFIRPRIFTPTSLRVQYIENFR